MECNVTETRVAVNEVVYEASVEQPVETDFTLPDYCPDIGKILKCRAEPGITQRTISGDKLNLEGVTKLSIIYVDGRDKHIRCCEHELPFTAKIPLGVAAENATASVRMQIEYINCRAVSQRRIDIRGAFSMHIRVTAPSAGCIISDAEGAGVRVRRHNAEVSTCVGRTQTAFVISESLELSDGKPPVASIIRSSAVIQNAECKTIANKLIVKGEAALKIVYNTEPEGRIEAMEYVLPFSQFLDMAGVDDGCATCCSLEIIGREIGLRTDSDGEYRRMSVDIRAVADVTAYRSGEISVVSDAYSVDCELETERKFLDFERYCGEYTARATADMTAESDRELVQILDSWCEAEEIASDVKNNNVHLSGKLHACSIVKCGDDDCDYIEKIVPFEYDIPVSNGIEEGRAVSTAVVRGCTYTLNGSNKLTIKAELAINCAVYDGVQLPCISSIKPDDSRKKCHDDEPALIVYFAEAGEELWDIAREHNSSVETIQSDNGISDAKLSDDRMLLISVR